MRTVQDFYTGYEGEPELIVLIDDEIALRCWEGYIAALLDGIPADLGTWTGLAEAWQLDLWGEGPWQPANLPACLAQLRAIETIPKRYEALAAEALQVRDALVAVMEQALAESASLSIRCD